MERAPDIVETTHFGDKVRTYARLDRTDAENYPKVEIDLPVSGDARVLIDGHELPITEVKIGRRLDELTEVTMTFFANVVGIKEAV